MRLTRESIQAEKGPITVGGDGLLLDTINAAAKAESCVRFPMLPGRTGPIGLIISCVERIVRFFGRAPNEEQREFNKEVLAALRIIAASLSPADSNVGMAGASGDLLKPGMNSRLDSFYLAFENRFRQKSDLVKEHLRAYLPRVVATAEQFGSKTRLLDIGCGRGEWLDLISEKEISCLGVETNLEMIKICRGKGHTIVGLDALSYLRQLPNDSLSVITAFHLVEHLAFADLIEMLDECYRVLMGGGLLILETPDPENIIVGTCNFHYDPTHCAPIPDKTLQFMVEFAGFHDVEILKFNPISEDHAAGSGPLAEVQRRFFMAQDYGLICAK